MMSPEVPVHVFWDIENCAVPSTMKSLHVVGAIKQFALQRGILKNMAAFANFKLLKEKLRADMQESGVNLHDIVNSKPNSSDMAILVEILKVVIDNKPPYCIVLISGDRDFANIISTLTFRKYKVVLIYSPQASEVLRNAATESVSWNELLKRGGGGGGKPYGTTPDVPQYIPTTASLFSDKFQPLLKILTSFGGYQVKWTDLGNIVPYDKLGYTKLSLYLFDAEDAGLVKCGSTNNIPWVTMLNGPITTQVPPLLSINKKLPIVPGLSPAYRAAFPMHSSSLTTTTVSTAIPASFPSPSLGNGISLVPSFASPYRAPPLDRNLVVNHLITALESLKKDFFKPTETTLQKRIKELNISLPSKLDWEDIVDIAKSHYFIVDGEKPNRIIFPPQSSFEGADPNHPRDSYPSAWWKAMHQFFVEVHPVAHTGRYGFALFLKEKGPVEVRDMPLGTITEMVQMALDKQLLMYNKKKSLVSTIGNVSEQTQNVMSHRALADEPDDARESEAVRSRLVGVTFKWPYTKGESVHVTGNFFNWRNTIALHCNDHSSSSSPNPQNNTQNNTSNNTRTSSNIPNSHGIFGGAMEPEDIFSTVLYLPPGLYEYKFIVDGHWLHDPRQPVVTDSAGNVNNIVDVKPLPATLREYV